MNISPTLLVFTNMLKPETKNIIIQLATNYIVWFVCVYTASKDYLWIGFNIAIILSLLQALSYRFFQKTFNKLFAFSFFLILLGFIVDSFLFYNNVFIYKANITSFKLSPPFLIGIWISFVILFYSTIDKWNNRLTILGIFAFFAFPFAYYVAENLGAAIAVRGYVSYVILGSIWLFLFPSYLYIFNRIAKK